MFEFDDKRARVQQLAEVRTSAADCTVVQARRRQRAGTEKVSVTMVLYIVGLGLGDEKDITVRGLEAVRKSSKVLLEHYTSIIGVDKAKLVSARMRQRRVC